MATPANPGTAAVWYAAASMVASEPDRWLLRISMTTAVGGSPRQDTQVTDIEDACELLRTWYALVTAGR